VALAVVDFNKSLASRIIPHQMFRQLCHLWQEMAMKSDGEKIFINEENLFPKDRAVNQQKKTLKFQLIITHNLQALLLVEKQIIDRYYQITITFEKEVIASFYEQILEELTPVMRGQLKKLLKQTKLPSDLSQEFLFKLLNIVTEPLTFSENYYGNLSNCQPAELILRNQIEQEKILHQVTEQIQENLDLLVIVKMTIEQVLHLLQIDRLIIYQFDVPLMAIMTKDNRKNQLVDAVTYEARASDIIPSILNFAGDDDFNKVYKTNQKYSEGLSLVINNLNDSKLDSWERKLMQKLGVKAKIVIPILVQNKLWGLLIAHQCFSNRTWKISETKFLEHISEYLAVAIYQSNSYQQLQEQKKFLEEQVQKKAQQLQDALIAAQVAHQSKTEFLGNISHELRTPLTCVIGLSGTLLHWAKDNYNLSKEKQKHYLEIIQESGRKLLQLINKTLDFAEIESGKSLLKIEELSLENLCRKACWSSLEIAESKNIKLNLDFQIKPTENLFHADPERLTQILLNLLENAIKFTNNGGEVIFRIWKEKNQVIFQVEDTGIGIYQEQFPLLFNKFQQLENYRTRTHSGTGLGLALTKHLVELHGGIIEVESIVGKGSIFTVRIPDSKPIQAAMMPQNYEKYVLENKTIVIVSKDEEIATFICELLTAAEYQIIWLFDSNDVMAKIKVLEPQLVILHQELSVVCRISNNIQNWKNKKQAKMMIICQKMNGDDWQKLSENGVDDYLLQPLQPALLLKKIRNLLKSE
jgi:two-component system sensor histidine kinase/response regulator